MRGWARVSRPRPGRTLPRGWARVSRPRPGPGSWMHHSITPSPHPLKPRPGSADNGDKPVGPPRTCSHHRCRFPAAETDRRWAGDAAPALRRWARILPLRPRRGRLPTSGGDTGRQWSPRRQGSGGECETLRNVNVRTRKTAAHFPHVLRLRRGTQPRGSIPGFSRARGGTQSARQSTRDVVSLVQGRVDRGARSQGRVVGDGGGRRRLRFLQRQVPGRHPAETVQDTAR